MFNKLLISTALVAVMGSAASAATVTFSQTLGDQLTNYTDRAATGIQKFDVSLGTLNSATITLNGTVSSAISYESFDAAASTITLTAAAQVALSTTLLGDLVVVLPTLTEIRNATAHDGEFDFDGTSGGSITGLTASLSAGTVVSGADLAEFVGPGFVDFSLAGTGSSSATGAGNIASLFRTSAGGSITVTYDYTETPASVPLPAGMPLMLLGMGAIGLVARRKS